MPVLAQDLRDTVLQAALCGKLSKPLNSDTKIEDTLETIKIKKDNYKWEKGKKKIKFNADLKVDIDIPSHWKVVKLGQISSILGRIGFRGFTKSDFTDNSGSICLTPGNLTPSNKMSYFKLSYIYKTKYDESPEIQVAEGDILLVKTGSSFGKAAIVTDLPKEATINPQLVRIVEHGINPIFLLIQFSSVFGKKQFNSFVTGTATPTFSQEKIANFNVLFPPIEEQQRIVDKLNKIMPLIDEYEKLEKQLVELKKEFPGDMKASILQAAMLGKLTEQLESDTPINLKLINQNKNRLMEKLDREIPVNWEKGCIESFCKSISTKKYQIKDSETLKTGLYKVVSQSQQEILGYSNNHEKLFSHSYPVVTFGDHTTVVKYIDFDFIVGADGLKIFEPNALIIAKYLYYVLEYMCIGLEDIGGYSRHYKYIKNKPIPIPPIEEQQRIVDKLDKIIPLINELKGVKYDKY